jgi:serine protease
MQTIENFKLSSSALITSVKRDELRRLEEVAIEGRAFQPLQSLSDYWLLDVRHVISQLQEIEAELRRLPEVDLVYRKKALSDPVSPDNNPYAAQQKYLEAAPVGIDARWVWTQANGDGAGMHLIDLEQGWLLNHEDLPSPTIIFGDNKDGVEDEDGKIAVGEHGAAVLGEVVGIDNTKGIIGIAPSVTTVRVVSYWDAKNRKQLDVADALLAAIAAKPRPHALLLEVETSHVGLPIETEAHVFDGHSPRGRQRNNCHRGRRQWKP